MAKAKTIVYIIYQNIIICLTQPRFYIALLLVSFLMNQVIQPIKVFSYQINIPVSPWIFPFLTQMFYMQMIMIVGIVFIFCDVPIINNGSVYILVRTGKIKWFFAQIGYIFSMTFIYYLCILIISILQFFPRIMLKNEWGKILGTLAQTDLGIEIGTESLDYMLQVRYTPLEALSRAFLIAWLVGIFTALIIMIFNIYFKGIIGAIVGTMIAFTPYFAWNADNIPAAHYISPAVWMNIMNSYEINRQRYPNSIYIFSFLILGIILLILLSYFKINKKRTDLIL